MHSEFHAVVDEGIFDEHVFCNRISKTVRKVRQVVRACMRHWVWLPHIFCIQIIKQLKLSTTVAARIFDQQLYHFLQFTRIASAAQSGGDCETRSFVPLDFQSQRRYLRRFLVI